MATSKTAIAEDEWLAELEQLGALEEDGDGLTVGEMADALGRARPWVRCQLHLAKKANRLVVAHERRPGLDGRSRLVPVYRLTAPQGTSP